MTIIIRNELLNKPQDGQKKKINRGILVQKDNARHTQLARNASSTSFSNLNSSFNQFSCPLSPGFPCKISDSVHDINDREVSAYPRHLSFSVDESKWIRPNALYYCLIYNHFFKDQAEHERAARARLLKVVLLLA
jgi:hypothetical protein